MPVWLMPSSVPTRYGPPPSIGRHRELSTLRNHLEMLLTGQGGLILIGGEEGIGKSTLAAAACQEAADAGALVLAGRCYDHAAQTPYSLWRDLEERYPAGGDFPPLPAMPANRDTAQPDCREACYTTICTFLTTLARRNPLVLVLEDLHWADPDSLDLLRTAARHLGTMPLLLICTYRNEVLARDHPLHIRMPALVREADATRLDLTALTESDLIELVEARYSLAPADAHSLAIYLHERTDGNPLFVTELLRLAEEEGHLRATPEGWWLSSLPQRDVPPLLRQVLDGRLRDRGNPR
jgi:predicted ATPase